MNKPINYIIVAALLVFFAYITGMFWSADTTKIWETIILSTGTITTWEISTWNIITGEVVTGQVVTGEVSVMENAMITFKNQPFFKLGADNNQQIAKDYIANNSEIVTFPSEGIMDWKITIHLDRELSRLEDIYIYFNTPNNGRWKWGHLQKLWENTDSYSYLLSELPYFSKRSTDTKSRYWTTINNIAEHLKWKVTVWAFVSSNRGVKIESIEFMFNKANK